MSYDLMVFDPLSPPADRAGFMNWYKDQSQWEEAHSYDNPDISTPDLHAWFFEMTKQYPPMNGPYASDDVDDPKVTDYSVGKSVIYAAFAWSEADAAHSVMFNLAQKHRVGFFDVSANDGGVWLPGPAGGYSCVHGQGVEAGKQTRKWWELWKKQ
jgi:hypothetical protein